MSKKILLLTVNGKFDKWLFYIDADPKHIELWRSDGLDIVQVENIIPLSIVDTILEKPFIFLQDIFNLKNPFKNKTGENVINVKSD